MLKNILCKVCSIYGWVKNKTHQYLYIEELDSIKALPTDYFYGVEDDMLDYLENLAYNSLKERKESHHKLREDCRKTLSLLLSGLGLFFGLAVAQLAKEHINYAAVVTILLACLWLFLCSVYLLKFGIQTIGQPPVYPDPDIFYDDWVKSNKISLNESRKRYLPSLQRDIEEMILINSRVARHLNRARLFAALTPALLVILICSL